MDAQFIDDQIIKWQKVLKDANATNDEAQKYYSLGMINGLKDAKKILPQETPIGLFSLVVAFSLGILIGLVF